MTLGRSPSQRFRLQHPSWSMIPSGFEGSEASDSVLLRLVDAIDMVVFGRPIVEARIEALKAQGKQTAYLEKQFKTWAIQAQKGLDWFANLIEGNTDVQSVIDNQAGVQTTPGLHEIRVGAWKEIVAELRKPIPLAGLGFLPILAETAAVVGRALANPAVWNGVKTILVAVIPWVGSSIVTSNVAEIVNGSADAKEKLEKCLEATEKANTAAEKAQVERLCGNATNSNTWLWLALGGAAGIGALLYFQSNPHKFSVQSRSAALSGMPRKRRRRK